MGISVTVPKTVIDPGEVVVFTAQADPIEDVRVDGYVSGQRVWTGAVYIKTLGINRLSFKPSLLASVVEFRFTGKDTLSTCPSITITVAGAVPPPEVPPPAPIPEEAALPWPLNVLWDWFSGAWNGFKTWVTGSVNDLWKGITDKANEIVLVIEGKANELTLAISEAPEVLFSGVFKVFEVWADEFNKGFEKGLEE